MILFFISIFILNAVYAADIITNRTGIIKITKPDGTVLTVAKDKPLPDIHSNDIVEVLDGSIDIMPVEGSLKIIAGNTVAIVESGDKATVSNYSAECIAEFKVHSGLIKTLTFGVKAAVPEGAIAKIGVDVEKRSVHTKSGGGIIEVASLQGDITRINKGESIDTAALSSGKIQPCPVKDIRLLFMLQEEPIEPERPEGSPFRP